MQLTTVTRTAILAAAMAIMPISAQAICIQTIYADHALSEGTYTQIFGRTSALSIHYYHGKATNPMLANLITSAAANRNRVYVVGDAASCPTTGNARDMGQIIQVRINP